LESPFYKFYIISSMEILSPENIKYNEKMRIAKSRTEKLGNETDSTYKKSKE